MWYIIDIPVYYVCEMYSHSTFQASQHNWKYIKGMEHVPNIFMSFDKYLF